MESSLPCDGPRYRVMTFRGEKSLHWSNFHCPAICPNCKNWIECYEQMYCSICEYGLGRQYPGRAEYYSDDETDCGQDTRHLLLELHCRLVHAGLEAKTDPIMPESQMTNLWPSSLMVDR